jgi:hypothetical protein
MCMMLQAETISFFCFFVKKDQTKTLKKSLTLSLQLRQSNKSVVQQLVPMDFRQSDKARQCSLPKETRARQIKPQVAKMKPFQHTPL